MNIDFLGKVRHFNWKNEKKIYLHFRVVVVVDLVQELLPFALLQRVRWQQASRTNNASRQSEPTRGDVTRTEIQKIVSGENQVYIKLYFLLESLMALATSLTKSKVPITGLVTVPTIPLPRP